LAEGTSQVRGLLDSLDIHSTLGVIEALGARVDLKKDADGSGLSGRITGWGHGGPRPSADVLWCGNSGTTARLLLGILSGFSLTAFLKGDESLSQRPMNRVTLPLSRMGACFNPSEVSCRSCISEPFDTLPLVVQGSDSLKAIDYRSPIASAQVKSAVLLAGIRAQGTTCVTEPHQSRNHTELLLPAYGVDVLAEGLTTGIVGGQRLFANDCEVPGDPSSAAFLLVAAALIPDSEVTVRNVLLNPTRVGFLEVMRRMGADIAVSADDAGCLGAEKVGEVTLRYREGLQATVVEAREIPALIDEVPILALLATAAHGTTVFRRVEELRVKESDRLSATIAGLTALGCRAYDKEGASEVDDAHDTCAKGVASATNDTSVECAEGSTNATSATSAEASGGVDLYVEGGWGTNNTTQKGRGVLETYGDHRLAMTWAIVARAFDLDITIQRLESVSVSYPGFFDDLKRLS
jgi:3-phosphoshikimate 1-carboxyvinyltransferase